MRLLVPTAMHIATMAMMVLHLMKVSQMRAVVGRRVPVQWKIFLDTLVETIPELMSLSER